MRVIFERELRLTPDMMAKRVQRSFVTGPRTKGVVHVQAINKALGVAAKKLGSDEDSPFEKFSDSYYPLMPALGVAWEEFRASTYPEDELIWQPGELERDGIYGSPDGMWMALSGVEGVDEPVAIWECKQTTKRIQGISELWMYLRQGMAYCAQSGLRHVLYDICFLLGDYQRPYQPKGMVCLVEFTDMEVEGWWSKMLAAAPNVKPE